MTDFPPVEITIPPHWIIDGSVPTGTLAALADSLSASAYQPVRHDDAVLIDINIATPIQAGNITVRADHGDDGHGLSLELATPDTPAAAIIVHRAPTRPDGPQLTGLLPTLRPDDALPYEGGRPGLARRFNIRPLPIDVSDRGISEAWTQPIAAASDTRLATALLALDAWPGPHYLDIIRAHASSEPPTARTNPVGAASVVLTAAGRSEPAGWWLLRSEVGSDRGHVTGELLDDRGQLLVRFDMHQRSGSDR